MKSIEFDLGACCDLDGTRQVGNFRMQDEFEEAHLQELRKKLRRRLNHCIHHDLTPRQRQMILMYYGKKMTMDQIGQELGVNRSAVSRTLARARKRLMVLLQPYLEILHNSE